jgi:hypothetical protein
MLLLLAHTAALLTMLFGWAAFSWLGFAVWWLTSEGRSRTALRFMRYSITAAVIFGAGMVVLGGVVLVWDVLATRN